MTRQRGGGSERAIYIISVAAELAGVHPQTLRVYERKGLLSPQRTEGNTRRYSERDIDRLRKIQELTSEGINLAGVTRILELEEEVERLKQKQATLARELERVQADLQEMSDARDSMALVPLKEVRRIRRALKADAIEAAGRRRTFVVPPVS
ncbi:MAG TPA: MerR family transcriptional regulator [Actinomycetota bacterium]|jgi:MerR family transcriptional regulator/heat shock protein HspR|nr:MerR family transcriptional regulator [Actinomycetota bacterium]